jgi:Tfp pilus assembly protein PilE
VTRPPDQRGFTLVETIAVVGPVLVRIAHQSQLVTGGQRRTAASVRVATRNAAIPFAALAAGCVVDSVSAFPNTTCTVLTDTAGTLRRVQTVIVPLDSMLTGPDTIILYRVNPAGQSPFNSP